MGTRVSLAPSDGPYLSDHRSLFTIHLYSSGLKNVGAVA
jgi:hypothetical protein